MAKKTEKSSQITPIKIKNTKEQWSEYTLSDGSVVRIRPVIFEIGKLKNKTSPDGKPIFQIKGGIITELKSATKKSKGRRKK